MNLPKRMKLVHLSQYGAPEVLKLAEAALPEVQAGEVLIEVAAAGVNFSDILRRRNTYFMPTPLPYVLGVEAVGTVVTAGPGVDHPGLAPGARVLAILPHGGGYAQYVSVAALYCVPLPPGLSDATATAIFVQGTTAHLLLHQVAGGVKGKSILVHAGASGVGSLLIQLARLGGASAVIATASTPEKRQSILGLGADAAIDYTQPGWTDAVVAANGGKQVDLVFEMVGGKVYEESFRALIPGGSMVVYGAASGEKGMVHSEHFVDENHQLLSFNLAHWVGNKPQIWQESLGTVIGLMASGQIRVESSHVFPLSQAAAAHAAIEARQTIGKVVLIPD